MKVEYFVAASLPIIFGTIVGRSTSTDTEWYRNLNKPDLQPPGSIFGIVWPILYIMMGIALYLILDCYSPSDEWYLAISLFVIQLVLNLSWSYVFFTKQDPKGALAILISLIVMLSATMYMFSKISQTATFLLLPYLLWLLFAFYLNYSIVQLN